jgi:hypothetical protein
VARAIGTTRARELGRLSAATRWAKYVQPESRKAQTLKGREAAFARFLLEADALTAKRGDGPLTDEQRLARATKLRNAHLTRCRMRRWGAKGASDGHR